MASPVTETEDERHAIEDIVGPRFELKKRLGAGATSQVYEALDRSCDRLVALKVMRPAVLAMPEVRVRLAHEVKAVASLDHPNIVRLYDANMHDGVLVLELVTGGSLQERIARGPVTKNEAVGIVKQIALALAEAHQAGVVHRDLKPANVLLGEGGVVKVTDFGVAHVGDSALTETGARIGTPAYMAPEQLRSARQVDARADVYAAGLVLYELLVGKRFHGDEEHDDPARVVKQACQDAEIAGLVARCLEEQRDKRFADGRALANALERTVKKPQGARAWAVGAIVALVAIAAAVSRVNATQRNVASVAPPASSSSAALVLPTPLRTKSPELERAIAHLYSLDMTGADAALDALVTADPANADASYYRAWARAFGAGRSDKLLEATSAALHVDQPPNRRTVLEAMEAYERHDFDGMLARVRPAAAASPNDWELAMALGEALSHSGAVDEGFATFDHIHALSPHFLLPWSHIIEMALARGDRDVAERWTAALRETPDARAIGIAWTMHWKISQGDAAGAVRLAEESPNVLVPRARLWNSDPISEARTAALALLGRFDDARRVSVDAAGNLRADPDAQTLAWIAYAQGRDAEWRRWMSTAQSDAKAGRIDRADLVHAEQSMAYSMAGDDAQADASLGLARAASTGEPSRSVAFASLLHAWRTRRAGDLPSALRGTPELSRAAQGVREAIDGDDRAAIADLEGALAIAAWAYSQVPIAWIGATLSRGHDEAAHTRFCDFIRRPRHLFWHWAYARAACSL